MPISAAPLLQPKYQWGPLDPARPLVLGSSPRTVGLAAAALIGLAIWFAVGHPLAAN